MTLTFLRRCDYENRNTKRLKIFAKHSGSCSHARQLNVIMHKVYWKINFKYPTVAVHDNGHLFTVILCLLSNACFFFTQEPAPWTKEGQARIAELGLTMQASDIFSCFYDHEFHHCKWLNDPTFFYYCSLLWEMCCTKLAPW